MNYTDVEISFMLPKCMIKKDNIECCVCFENNCGVKLQNCNHFICQQCYLKIYHGYISYTFYNNNPEPIYPKKPDYPFTPFLI